MRKRSAFSAAGHAPHRLAGVLAAMLLATTTYAQENAPTGFGDLKPLWVGGAADTKPAVVLFRHRFTLRTAERGLEISIFADTRYQLWLDGSWLGRGPARFLRDYREYDTYRLPPLAPGNHVVAVLVQFAPGARRSESVAPHLQLRVARKDDGTVLTSTNAPGWRAWRPPAWDVDARPIDTRGLIGPTEILDLQALPMGWPRTDYEPRGWSEATEARGYTKATYRPRSIAALEEVPMPATVLERGRLSPGRQIAYRGRGGSERFRTEIDMAPGGGVVEVLAASAPAPGTVTANGVDVPLTNVGPKRPDVWIGNLAGATNELAIEASIAAFAVSGTPTPRLPFEPGPGAGERLLLAEAIPDPAVVSLKQTTELSTDLELSALPSYVVFDLGRTIHGRLRASVEGPPGTVVDIGWDERIHTKPGRPLPHPGSLHPEWSQVDAWVLDGSRREVTTIDTRSGRYVTLAAWGEGPVSIRGLEFLEERYPAARTGSFESSDPFLDRVWQLGVETLWPNRTDAYTDTPWRERAQWWGDAYVAHHIERVSVGDDALLRRGIEFMRRTVMAGAPAPGVVPGNDRRHMIDYSLLWILSVADYVERHRDHQLADETYPAVQRVLDHLTTLEDPQSGLLTLPRGHWSTTAYVGSAGSFSRTGTSTAINALYAEALGSAAVIARYAGKPAQAKTRKAERARVIENMNAALYDPEKRQYWTALLGEKKVPPTLHAQAWPLVYGVVPPGEIDAVTDALARRLPHDPRSGFVHTYDLFWVLDALGRAGRIEQAQRVIRRYYRPMLKANTGTLWENLVADESPRASLSHVWAGAPTWFASTYVLGAREISEQTWRVEPALEGVAFASGAIPLSHGRLGVAWRTEPDGNASLTIDAPSDSRGLAVLPTRAVAGSWYAKGSSEAITAPTLQLEGGRHVLRFVPTPAPATTP